MANVFIWSSQLFPYIQNAIHFTHARMEGRGRLFHKLKLTFPCNKRGHSEVRQSSGSSPLRYRDPHSTDRSTCHSFTNSKTPQILAHYNNYFYRFHSEERAHFKNWNKKLLRVLMGMMSCIPGVCRCVQEYARACAQGPKVSSKSLVVTLHPPHWGKVSLATWLPIQQLALGSLPPSPRCCDYRCWWHPPGIFKGAEELKELRSSSLYGTWSIHWAISLAHGINSLWKSIQRKNVNYEKY